MSRIVEIRRLDAGYRSHGSVRRALRGVDLGIDAGEVVALIGPNGSGKTSLVRCVAGTLTPTAGEVRLWGRSIAEYSRVEIARRVAVLPQSLELPGGFDVSRLVAMGRGPHARRLWGSSPEDRVAVERALEDAGATQIADRRVEELSGGERQRVLVALALAQEPELLLMDEPTTHLDLAHAMAVLECTDRLRAARGVTVVVVLHDLGLAAAWARRVVLLDAGRVVADGPPEEVMQPEVIGRAYGVPIEVVRTDGGRTIVVPRLSGT